MEEILLSIDHCSSPNRSSNIFYPDTTFQLKENYKSHKSLGSKKFHTKVKSGEEEIDALAHV